MYFLKNGFQGDSGNYSSDSLMIVLHQPMENIIKYKIIILIDKQIVLKKCHQVIHRGKSCLTKPLEFFEFVKMQGCGDDLVEVPKSQTFKTFYGLETGYSMRLGPQNHV